MRSIHTLGLYAGLFASGLGSVATAQTAATTALDQPFPLAMSEAWTPLAVRLDPVPGGVESLRARDAVRLIGVSVPSPNGVEELDLELTRLRLVGPETEWRVDDKVVGGGAELDAEHSLWRGRVRGESDSSVYLAFTSTGSRGWIERADGKSHLVSVPVDGDWTETYSVLVHESDAMIREGAPSYACQALARPDDLGIVPSKEGASGMRAGRAATTWECKIALETDYQYWQLFGDTTAATNYALSLLGAVSDRFLDACDTFVTLPYLGIYSNSNDPWTAQDNGGGAGEVLDEFRSAWGGSPFPGNAHLAHMISGAGLGGGVAYLDVLCNQDYGFAVSGNLSGQTNFPVPTQDALNWDFVVTAHETGHNVGTPHTHDFCPPIDSCAPSGYFGACQSGQTCQTGTIMSYCHLCSGGINNVKTEFHPTVGALMASTVQASCIPSYPAASVAVRNGTIGCNPVGYSSWTPPELGTNWVAQVDLTPTGALASFIGGTTGGPMSGIKIPIGEVLLNLTQPLVLTDAATGLHIIPVPNDLSLLGVVLYTQAAALGGGGTVLQNAIDLSFGR